MTSSSDSGLMSGLENEERVGTTKVHSAIVHNGVSAMSTHSTATFSDLTTPGINADVMANTLVGAGVTISNVSFTGDNRAGGIFELTGDHDVLGISSGIVLSSGKIIDAEGPNAAGNTSTAFGTPGDLNLTALSGFTTYDAAILEFDFTVEANADRIFIQYVFGSEEYNEYVGAGVNDSFGFFVNGVNCAVVGDQQDPVSIDTINLDVNSEFYINNDPFHGGVAFDDLLFTEMDGFTVVLVCEAEVIAGETNTMKLAIADAGDRILDSWVFLGEGSLTTVPPTEKCVDLVAAQNIVAGNVCVISDDKYVYVTYQTFGDWLLSETHLALSMDLPGSGEWVEKGWTNRSGNPAPGQFANHSQHSMDPVQSYTYEIPLEDIGGMAGEDNLLYLASHAVVVIGDEEKETAWGAETRFRDQGNWATYFTCVLP